MHIKDFDPYDFSEADADGVRVLYKNLPWAPCIHIYFQLSAGAFTDPVGKEGLSHFLEHMIGNGSPMLPSRKAVKEFGRLYTLNSRNAFTGHYRTAYTAKCFPEHFVRVAQTMKDYVFNPLLRAEDIETERSIITEEAWGVYKNERFARYVKEISKIVFHGHERERIASPLGWPTTIHDITADDVRNYHAKTYTKENLTVFIVGAIEDDHIKALLDILKDIPSGEVLVPSGGFLGDPTQPRSERYGEDIGYIVQQASFDLSRAVNRDQSLNEEASDQAASLLQDALFERLRTEHSLCYGVKVKNNFYKDYLVTGIAVDTSQQHLARAEAEIWNVIREISDGVWEERFNNMHVLHIDQLRSNELATSTILDGASGEFSSIGRIISLKEMLEKAEKVTYADVRKTVSQTFDPAHTFTEIILPSEEKKS